MRSVLVAIALLVSSASYAQGTSPPTPDAPYPPESPAAQAEGSSVQAEHQQMKSKLQSLYEDFRHLKDHLPFALSAGAYLYYYQPLTHMAWSPTDRTGTLQLYAFYLKLDSEWHGLGGHVELRMRDGGHVGAGGANDYLRGFYTSNVWFQEIYAYYKPWSILDVKVGKLYRRVGLFWDDSFFGNVQYFDGNKLVPDWGVSVEGQRNFAHDKLGLEYSAQYFLNSSGTNGSIDAGRTIGPAPNLDASANPIADARIYSPTAIGETDSLGNRIGSLKHIVDARVALTVRPTRSSYFTVGASGLNAFITRQFALASLTPGASGTVKDVSHFSQAAAELTIGIGLPRHVGLRIQAEYTRQLGPGMRDADYVLAGARLTWKGLAVYCNNSYVRYLLDPDVEELIIQPGISYAIGGGLAALVEIDDWMRRDPRGVATAWNGGTTTHYYPLDRSLNAVLAYSY